jgi:hypothetical protein
MDRIRKTPQKINEQEASMDEVLDKAKVFVIICALFVARFAFAQPEAPLTIHYVERPPYAIIQPNGEPTGFVATPTAGVLRKAQIPFVWAKTPVNRQFAIIKENTGRDCTLGMEQTPSRSHFAKFTEPLYISQPLVAILHPSVREKKGVTIRQLLQKYSILVKENYTLGDDLTALVMKSPKKQLTSSESMQMVQMIALDRADFMMISNDEVEYYINQGILNPKGIRLMELPDAKKRFTRRLMCSLKVDDATIQKINREIRTLHVKPAPMKTLATLP